MVLIIGAGTKADKASIDLATKKNRRILNEQVNLSEKAMREFHAEMSSNHPQFELRSIATGYNCFGMVFACRRTWVEPEELGGILEDDGYKPIGVADARANDVALYWKGSTPIHVALVVKQLHGPGALVRLKLLSKFGKYCEYEHLNDDVPRGYEYDRFEVFTERLAP